MNEPEIYPASAADIDWTDPEARVSAFFSVKECLWLPQWNRLANQADGFNPAAHGVSIFDFVTGSLWKLRVALGLPFIVHVFYRPPAYNDLIKGAKDSAHMAIGPWAAVDFDLNGAMSCDDARKAILGAGYLAQFGLRMEDRQGSDWIHIGNDVRRGPAYFKP